MRLRKVLRSPSLFLATGGGLGLVPRGAGSLGALLGLILAFGMHFYLSPVVYGAVTLFLIGLGVPVCSSAARQLGSKDPSSVIWDEMVTIPLVFWGTHGTQGMSAVDWSIGFVLHRIFDISKLYPASRCEAWPGGLGIMADDCVAAIYACLGVHFYCWLSAGEFLWRH